MNAPADRDGASRIKDDARWYDVSMPPLVTWMIPVLNGMPYLPQTLASIEAQTFKDSQVLVWDNGSTDGTVEELNRWIPSRLPGRIVTGQPLLLGLARAAMVTQCGTEFGALIDADDINFPDRLQRQIDFLVAHPDIMVLGTQMRQMTATGEVRGTFGHYPLLPHEIVWEMLRSNPIAQPTVVFRTEAVLKAGNYRDFSPTHVEDFDLWLRMAAQKYKMQNLPEVLVQYRVHERSTTQKSIAANRLDTEMNLRLADAAEVLFGCSKETMLQLKSRNHSRAFNELAGIAQHLQLSQKFDFTMISASELDAWRSPVFCRAARQIIAAGDVNSRLRFAIARSGLSGACGEIAAITSDLLRSVTRRLRLKHKQASA